MNRRYFMQSGLITGAGLLIPTTSLAGFLDDFFDDFSDDVDDFIVDIGKSTENYNKFLEDAIEDYQKELEGRWGEALLPEKKIWVGYSQVNNKEDQTRYKVDYEKEKIEIAMLVDKNLSQQEIGKRLNDAKTRLFNLTEEEITKNDKLKPKIEEAENAFAASFGEGVTVQRLAENKLSAFNKKKPFEKFRNLAMPESITQSGPARNPPIGGKKIVKSMLSIAGARMVSAQQIFSIVGNRAGQYKQDAGLIYSMIETESNFNAHAVSKAFAYGLMQMTKIASIDVSKELRKWPKNLYSRQWLFDEDNNILAGTTYLNMIGRNFRRIKDDASKRYCVIAGYNAGPARVAKTLAGNRATLGTVHKTVNELSSEEVRAKLERHLPNDENREYVGKVMRNIKGWQKFVRRGGRAAI